MKVLRADEKEVKGYVLRRSPRAMVKIPVVIKGVDKHGYEFEEETETYVVSKYGARVSSVHEIEVDDILQFRAIQPAPVQGPSTRCPPSRVKMLTALENWRSSRSIARRKSRTSSGLSAISCRCSRAVTACSRRAIACMLQVYEH